jgi:ribosomal protein S18 acetylase RimI-like enzyme
MKVRSMKARDLPRVGELAAEMVALHHGWDARRFFVPDSPAEGYRWWFSKELERKAAVLLVAEVGDAVAGYLYGTCEERDWNALRDPGGAIHDVLVDRAFRRRGVGEALVAAAVAHFAKRGLTQIVLSTATKNKAAQKFFAKLGFRSTMIEMTRDLDD